MTAYEPMPPVSMPDPPRRHPVAIAIAALVLIAVVAAMLMLAKRVIGPTPAELAGTWSDGSARLVLSTDGTFVSDGVAFFGGAESNYGWSEMRIHREGAWRIDQSATDEGRGVLLETATGSTVLLIKDEGRGWRLVPRSPDARPLTRR